jgi:DNA-binding beta-propeller fold protein YncE
VLRHIFLVLVVFVASAVSLTGAAQDAEPAIGPLALFFPTLDVARLDPVTLEPLGPRVGVGEYHGVAAISPDGTQLAAGTGGPGGQVQIIDIQRMEAQHSVYTGIAVEALAWLGPRRIVAAMQCNPRNVAGRGCGIAVVDSTTGEVVRRWPETEADTETLPFVPGFLSPKTFATTPHGIVFLLIPARRVAPARLVVIRPEEELRSVTLSSIATGQERLSGPQQSAGLAIPPAGGRAYVVGLESIVTEVDLETLEIRDHPVEGLDPTLPFTSRRAFWLNGQIVVHGAGSTHSLGAGVSWVSGSVPAGVMTIDTTSWRARTIDADAHQAVEAAGLMLVYGGRSSGLTGYSADGERRFHLFADDDHPVASVYVDGLYAYAVSIDPQLREPDGRDYVRESHVRVVDVATGQVIREARPSARLIGFAHPYR